MTLFGSGEQGLPSNAKFHRIKCRPRDRFEGWPRLPALRTECYYEELSFAWNLSRSGLYRASDYDIVFSCTYPWINWYLRRQNKGENGRRPVHVYVTQNGDWPCQARSREFRYFHCDGLVCTNPEFYERNQDRWTSMLIPNGVDPEVFRPGEGTDPVPELGEFAQRPGARVVMMASALVSSKDVAGGVRAVARVPDVALVIAGDGPERERVAELAQESLPGRHTLLGSVSRDRMPGLFRRADAFLHMSRDEPSALVYLEAASTGLPMVVHDWAVTRWTLGDAAIYTNTADAEATGAAAAAALEPATAARLGAAARARVLNGWSWQVLADRYLEFFESLRRARDLLPTPRGSVTLQEKP